MKIPFGVKYIIGIDEAGRGPLAGPVSVGVCVVPTLITRKVLLKYAGMKKIKDSKKLSESLREEWFGKLNRELKEQDVFYAVTLISNTIIDTKGISFAIKQAMEKSLVSLEKSQKINPEHCYVLLDGGLKAPARFLNQKTIIKGDEKEFAISLASIAAKVMRDKHMARLAKKYPPFGFELHKGYGTRQHIKAIKNHGASPIHRRSFLKNILV